jgi:hypothetical protein
MRKLFLSTVMAAAAISATAFIPGQAGAMTLGAPAGLRSAAAELNQIENVGCGWNDCSGVYYYAPPPHWGYYSYYTYYRPYYYRPAWGCGCY